jgi:hypothetical protein
MPGIESKMKGYCTVSAVVTRADRTVEDLGIICSSKPKTRMEKIKDWLVSIKISIKKR